MLRIFRHYIPTSLVLLGLAETLILLVSIYVGVSFGFTLSDDIGATVPTHVWAQAIVFCITMLIGMAAMGFYQREQRDGFRDREPDPDERANFFLGGGVATDCFDVAGPDAANANTGTEGPSPANVNQPVVQYGTNG